MDEKILKLWMPITKAADGRFMGILSDSSVDRDGEFMTKELLKEWSKVKSVKALVNHENKMEKWVGGWDGFKLVEKGEHVALVAEPWFFSQKANPLAQMVKYQVEEAIERGENAGISIGAIPLDSIEKDINGKICRGYTKAELLEGTWVPIQSNRNAQSFGAVAKAFDINMEDTKMTDKIKKDQEEIIEEPVSEQPVEEPVSEQPVEEPVAEQPSEDIVEKLQKRIADLEKSLSEMKKAVVNKKPDVESGEAIVKEVKFEDELGAHFQRK